MADLAAKSFKAPVMVCFSTRSLPIYAGPTGPARRLTLVLAKRDGAAPIWTVAVAAGIQDAARWAVTEACAASDCPIVVATTMSDAVYLGRSVGGVPVRTRSSLAGGFDALLDKLAERVTALLKGVAGTARRPIPLFRIQAALPPRCSGATEPAGIAAAAGPLLVVAPTTRDVPALQPRRPRRPASAPSAR